MGAWELLLAAGAGAAAISAVAALLWWLLSPRVTSSIERACDRALAPIVREHDERLERLEASAANSRSPEALVELAALLDMVRDHAPAVIPGPPRHRPPRTRPTPPRRRPRERNP